MKTRQEIIDKIDELENEIAQSDVTLICLINAKVIKALEWVLEYER